MAMRVLAFMAHPDDVEFSCAGTLARLKREAGCEIVIATATSGDCGTMEYRPEEIARLRHAEAVAGAKVLDAEYYCGRCKDLLVMYDEPTLQRFVEIVRRARPDIVMTQPPSDYLIDHEICGRLVRTAVFAAPAPNFLTFDEEPAPPAAKVPYLYYVDPPECKDLYGDPVKPAFIVDISSTIDIKEKMLACHVTQRNWLRAHHGMDEYIDSMKRTGAERGKQIGRAYGEGFRQHLGHAYPNDNIIAKLLKM